MSRYMLEFDYPDEDERCVGVETVEQIATELLHDFAEDEAAAAAMATDLLRDGVWRDEGGKIVLYKRVGADGVQPTDEAAFQREAMEMALRALHSAAAGLEWYRDRCPDAVDGSDDEADDEIGAAIAALDAALGVQPTEGKK